MKKKVLNVEKGMKIEREEVLGKIIQIIKLENEEDEMKIENERDYGIDQEVWKRKM